MPAFIAMQVAAAAAKLEAEGRSIIKLNLGEPDFTAPIPVVDAATQSLRQGRSQYTMALGLDSLREAIAKRYRRSHNIDVPANRIAVTTGASGALVVALLHCLREGDQVLMADPTYPCNKNLVRAFGSEVKLIASGAENNYQLTPELVDKAWGPRTRAVMVASPSNPTGTTIPFDRLAAIHQLVRRRGGVLIADEIYHGLTYEEPARSALELGDDLYVLGSFSKYFCMTGWRVGWLAAPIAAMTNIEALAQNLYICPPAVSQYAALEALNPANSAEYEGRRAEFRRRRDLMVAGLRRIGFDIAAVPDGAFYIYARCDRFGPSEVVAQRALHRAGVAITPGIDFGNYEATKHVRVAFTASYERLEESLFRLQREFKEN